ncbi:porin [Nitrosospira lacus]|uniref:Porin n=1 Tax=Nitrosospira lacus TaxID=1288494 RepID=A0A1W6SSL3_9PROT|nr:porin [Nitrosospira lacus]ARO88787.1 porin [Nitrosospira lacus]
MKAFQLPMMASVLACTLYAISPSAYAQEDLPEEPPRSGKKKTSLKPKKKTGFFFEKSGFGLRSDDGINEVRIGGFAQTGWKSQGGSRQDSTVETDAQHRALLTIDGKFGKVYGFRIAPSFANTVGILDAYVNANFTEFFKVSLGKLKVPFGLERIQSATALAFNGRAFPSDLVPNRDIGIQIFGNMSGGATEYQIGAFNGAVDNDAALRHGGFDINNNGIDFVGRIFSHPFRNGGLDILKDFGLGVAYSQGLQESNETAGNANLPAFHTPGQHIFASYVGGAFANGVRERISPQFHYYNGRLGVIGEYVLSRQEITLGTATHKVNNDAFQIQSSWFVTNDNATFRRMTPRNPFNWSAKTWGAVELVARYAELNIDHDAFTAGFFNPSTSARKAKDIGVGINWHLNRHIKLQLNYHHTTFEHGAADGADRPDEKVLFSRLQIAF